MGLESAALCPDYNSTTLPWNDLRSRVSEVLACALNSECGRTLPLPPYRFLLPIADEICYRDSADLARVKLLCPAGFALAYACVIFFGQMESNTDPVQIYGSGKFAATGLLLRDLIQVTTIRDHYFFIYYRSLFIFSLL